MVNTLNQNLSHPPVSDAVAKYPTWHSSKRLTNLLPAYDTPSTEVKLFCKRKITKEKEITTASEDTCGFQALFISCAISSTLYPYQSLIKSFVVLNQRSLEACKEKSRDLGAQKNCGRPVCFTFASIICNGQFILFWPHCSAGLYMDQLRHSGPFHAR